MTLINESENKNITYFIGVIVKGRGIGKTVIKAQSAFLKEHDIEVFPGTLNVVLNKPLSLNIKKAKLNYCDNYHFWVVKINGIDCLAHRWKHCPYHIIEIISRMRLRDSFSEKQENVEIEIQKDLLEQIDWWNLLMWNLAWRGRYKAYYTSDIYVKIINRVKKVLYKITTFFTAQFIPWKKNVHKTLIREQGIK